LFSSRVISGWLTRSVFKQTSGSFILIPMGNQ